MKIEFDGNRYYTNTVAICNEATKTYQINGEDVSREKITNYVSAYQNIDFCEWNIIDESFYGSDDSSSEPIDQTPDRYILL